MSKRGRASDAPCYLTDHPRACIEIVTEICSARIEVWLLNAYGNSKIQGLRGRGLPCPTRGGVTRPPTVGQPAEGANVGRPVLRRKMSALHLGWVGWGPPSSATTSGGPLLTSASPITFLPSTDLDRSRQFFADRLGLAVEEVTPFACVVRVGTTMLRVTKVDQLQVQPFTVFGWEVTDIHAVVADLARAGVRCVRFDGMDQDAAAVWTTPGGDWIAWFRDPDGNLLSLTQFTGHGDSSR